MPPPAIERSSPLPLYHQLKQILLDRIDSGAWRAGELIPTEQELQDTYGLSRTTVRQALRELELEGRITRHRGRGTFVSTPKLTHGAEPRSSLTESLRAAGMSPGWQVLSITTSSASPDIAERLAVPTGAPIRRLARLRLANREPIGVLVAHVAPAFAHHIDEARLTEGSSLDYLRGGGELAGAALERLIEAVPCGADDAELLGAEPGAPMLRIERRLTTAAGAPIELLIATYRGDRFQYHLSGAADLREGA